MLTEIAKEFELLGYTKVKAADIAALARVLRAQRVDFGEIGITAACLGYLVAKGLLGRP